MKIKMSKIHVATSFDGTVKSDDINYDGSIHTYFLNFNS